MTYFKKSTKVIIEFQKIIGEYPPLNTQQYSEDLRLLIDNMLRVNPTERLEIKEVVKVCEIQRANLKKPRIDPFLIMDDIIEKLKLLNYENLFCRKKKQKQIA
jgi:hypothetical protein